MMDNATGAMTEAGSTGFKDDAFDTQIFVALVSIIGIIGNSFAISVLCQFKKMRKRVGNFLLINQCLIDLCASCFISSFALITLTTYRKYYETPYRGIAGELFCRLWGTGLWPWGLMTSSTYNLLMVTLERYLMVVHPIYHKNNITPKKVYIMAGVAWLSGLVFRAVWGIPSSKLGDFYCLLLAVWPGDDWPRAYGIISVLYEFLIPAILMSGMYIRMVHKLRSRRLPSMKASGQQTPSNLSRAQKNLTKTFIIVIIVYIGCWTINQFNWLMFNLGWNLKLNSDFNFLSIILVYINCCINPFIYIFSYKDFQQSLKHLCGCKTSVVHPDSSHKHTVSTQ